MQHWQSVVLYTTHVQECRLLQGVRTIAEQTGLIKGPYKCDSESLSSLRLCDQGTCARDHCRAWLLLYLLGADTFCNCTVEYSVVQAHHQPEGAAQNRVLGNVNTSPCVPGQICLKSLCSIAVITKLTYVAVSQVFDRHCSVQL